jgi:hypothetical protein
MNVKCKGENKIELRELITKLLSRLPVDKRLRQFCFNRVDAHLVVFCQRHARESATDSFEMLLTQIITEIFVQTVFLGCNCFL